MGQFEISPNTGSIEHHQQLFKQTYTLLELYRSQAISNPKFAREYLGDETMGFLKKALQGAETAYHRRDRTHDSTQEPLVEAADIAYIVFAWMHDLITSPYVPTGFSRNGILQAPQSPEEFRKRIQDIQTHLGMVVSNMKDNQSGKAILHSLRTRSFFHTGSILPLQIPNSTNQRREYINNLLRGIDTELG